MKEYDENKNIIEFLKKTYPVTKRKRLLCKCGLLQCHGAQWCSECGGEFTLDPTKIALCTRIYMQSTNNQYRMRDNGNDAYRYWEIICSIDMGIERIEVERFKKLCIEASRQLTKEIQNER